MRSGTLTLSPHPLLDLGAFCAEWPAALSELPSPDWLQALLATEAPAPLSSDDAVRGAVRDLLRHGGYKPTGRGKPASEYLLRAAAEGGAQGGAQGVSSINAAVDACNAVSLHSGLPVSVVDLDRAQGALRVAIAAAGESYVFNRSGQTIDLAGLLCLYDEEGPCANAVKDAQRTKTQGDTRRTLQLLWGVRLLGDRTARATAWYRELAERLGAKTSDVTIA